MLALVKRYKNEFARKALIGTVFKGIEVVFELFTPIVVARMIDEGVNARDMGLILHLGGLLVVFALVGYLSTLVTQRLASEVSQGMGTRMCNDVFKRIVELSAKEVESFGAGSLVTRVTSDINQVQLAIAMVIRTLVRWPLIAFGSMVAAILIDPQLGSIFAVTVPLIAIAFWFITTRSVPLFGKVQQALDAISSLAKEDLAGVRVIRAFSVEEREQARFEGLSKEHMGLQVQLGRLSALLNPVTLLVMNLSIVAILWQSGARVQAGTLTQGEVVAFVNYVTQMLLSVSFVANLIIVITKGLASSKRVEEVLACEPSITSPADEGFELPGAAAAIRFDDVSYSFSREADDVLSHVSFTLERGATLGVIGGTGSGKSTLVNLLARIYDVNSGSIELFGRDVRDWPLDRLHKAVSVVPQHHALVEGSIRSNLLWRDENASDEELLRALEVAQAQDIVSAKAEGLDEPVLSGGSNFSGGQRARLCIARALVGDPDIIVLDDAASALDFATDARLRREIAKLGCTKVIVSQRVSAVRGSDAVLVLDHGRMAGFGTHDVLLASCSLYRQICDSQAGQAAEGGDHA